MDNALTIESRKVGQSVVINLTGKLDHDTIFRLHRAIRLFLKQDAREIVLDCGQVKWLDSMAMGSLLGFRQQFEAVGKKMVLANCQGELLSALRLFNFHKLFELR